MSIASRVGSDPLCVVAVGRPVAVGCGVDERQADQRHRELDRQIEQEDLPHRRPRQAQRVVGQPRQRAKGDDGEKQRVDGDADGVAGQNPRPLVASRDARDEPVVNLRVDQLTDQLGHN